MKYKELLDLCDNNHIDKYGILIANEVEFFFSDEGGRYRPDFEQLCELVSDTYLKVDNSINISVVVDSLYRLIVDQKKDINTINRYDITGNMILY